MAGYEQSIEQRVNTWKSKTVFEGNCWRYKTKYRPILKWKGRKVTISRLSAHLFLGLDLNNPKQQANHKRDCPHEDCWNPDHLYIGTQRDNVRDSIGLGNHNFQRRK